jgi:hypothetical protein
MDLSPDDLGVLAPPRAEIKLASGTVLVLSPVRVRHLAAFVRALGPSWRGIVSPDRDLWDLIAEYGDNLSEALAIAAEVPRETVEAMQPGEYLEALDAMLRINGGFFGRWLRDRMMTAALLQMRDQSAGGPT